MPKSFCIARNSQWQFCYFRALVFHFFSCVCATFSSLVWAQANTIQFVRQFICPFTTIHIWWLLIRNRFTFAAVRWNENIRIMTHLRHDSISWCLKSVSCVFNTYQKWNQDKNYIPSEKVANEEATTCTLNKMVSKCVVSISLYCSGVYLHHVDSNTVSSERTNKFPKSQLRHCWQNVAG